MKSLNVGVTTLSIRRDRVSRHKKSKFSSAFLLQVQDDIAALGRKVQYYDPDRPNMVRVRNAVARVEAGQKL